MRSRSRSSRAQPDGRGRIEGVATLLERQPLRDPPLQFDRADFRTVLFRLRAPLRGFVVAEVSTDTLSFAVEDIDEGPKRIGEISLEAGVEKDARQSFDGGLER